MRALKRGVLAAALCLAAGAAQAQQMTLAAGGHQIKAEVVSTERARQFGLMYRSHLPPDQGMLFVYSSPIRLCMWMKNTLIPLSVAFLDEDGRILNIEDMSPQSEESHCAAKAVRFALEMNRGWFVAHGIKPGDRIEGVKDLSAN
ncbi:MAG: DUF192 domain-containing protein [Azoarcus sp.]|jgi:uncharacterized membrane protein (UPF0127 family)|nr:DUF192 domain-containing protein [Azoarcus sp.]